jgi:hypothetical protein
MALVLRNAGSPPFSHPSIWFITAHHAIGYASKGNQKFSGLLINIKALPYTLPFLLPKGYNVQINNQYLNKVSLLWKK